ncbi:hypothetical protein NXT3_PC00947 (plasmid) [Sinorhizobium fredii]|uniref:Uncharacterized protein n=1 Tax=Rhizobium fredii TaxID=380 RepID=A0A2L0HF87_RHIFR|nr:hypothetical protein NXT3_PC00947 [Sinorhizobium fredii]
MPGLLLPRISDSIPDRKSVLDRWQAVNTVRYRRTSMYVNTTLTMRLLPLVFRARAEERIYPASTSPRIDGQKGSDKCSTRSEACIT